jgi:hypothetical protein
LNTLLFTEFAQEKLSLNDLSVELSKRHQIYVTKQSIDERFTERSVEFMKTLLEQLLPKIIDQEPVMKFLNAFESVKIKDSTCFQLPESMVEKYAGSGGSASKAQIRIQFEYDCKTGKIYDLSLHAFNEQDTTNAIATTSSIQKNDLIIRDLGYIVISVLLEIQEKEAFYINRHNFNSNAYENIEDKEPIDFEKIQKYLKKNKLNSLEKDVYIGVDKRLKTRMIIELLPDEKKELRLRNANQNAQKKGKKVSKKYKAHIGLNAYITNITSEILPINQVRTLYRLRWQVELVFKVWKSVGEIDKVKKIKIERFETMLYAKLIWIMLNWSILWQMTKYFWREKKFLISTIKTFKTFKNQLKDFQNAITKGTTAILEYIEYITRISPENHQFEGKKNQLSSLEIMLLFVVKKS